MRSALGVLIVAMLTLPAAGQAPETFPFGMENVKWKMSYAEVKAQLEPSAPEIMAPPGAPLTNQRGYFWGPLHWNGCVLQMWTYFANDQLDYVYVEPERPVSYACNSSVEQELTAHFGEGLRREFMSPFTHKSVSNVTWTTPTTRVQFGGGTRSVVNLYEVGGPEFSIIN